MTDAIVLPFPLVADKRTSLTTVNLVRMLLCRHSICNMVCSTMAPLGEVDYDALIHSAGGGLWSDPDFPHGEYCIWIDGQRSGFGSISTIGQVLFLPALPITPVDKLCCFAYCFPRVLLHSCALRARVKVLA